MNKRIKHLVIVVLLLSILLTQTGCIDKLLQTLGLAPEKTQEEKKEEPKKETPTETAGVEIFNNGNIDGVESGATSPSFTIDTPYRITKIMCYHYNYGKGASPGSISIQDEEGNLVGKWAVDETGIGQGNVPNAYWYIHPNIDILPGTYKIIDSSPGTWSQNDGSGGEGMTIITAYEVSGEGLVDLKLTYPAGKSPKVFTKGWVFGTKALLYTGEGETEDISDQVTWSGTGKFSPSSGGQSRPVFNADGKNEIKLTVKVGKRVFTKKYKLETVSPDGYAKVGDFSVCPADAHGCPACPHHVIALIEKGSSTVKIGGKGAARVGDSGRNLLTRASGVYKGDSGYTGMCCGSNTFKITVGDNTVLIDGKPAVRYGDATAHCGGVGRVTKKFTFKSSSDKWQDYLDQRMELLGPDGQDLGLNAPVPYK